ncbi:MAG: HNH endonuclease [Candidatus Omnitrophica bacterium]|nr:HNH endonuclease [Candidatus Omnitrophota bacterium]MBU1996193.1 HNH endonuclease [Candidatus Omnitrophota bacterium]
MRFTRIDQEKDRYLLEFLGLDYDGDEKKTSYAVIAENDESLWEDVKGEIYHFPNKYKNILKTGVKVIYYKGAIQKKKYSQQRLSDAPHYFGYAEIGEIAADLNSKKGDLFCGVENFVEFKRAIPIKNDNKYLEVIPESQKSNYWRDGVRKINKEVYENILSYADKKITSSKTIQLPPITGEFESYFKEGKKKERFTTYYERNSINRKRAIEIHGYDCKVCGMNFSSQYGKQGDKYIHVHHIRPISSVEGEVKINPKTDLTVLCANCHAMVHRYKDQTLSIEELKGLLVGTLKVRD